MAPYWIPWQVSRAPLMNALSASGYPTHPTEAFRYIIGDGASVAAQRCLPSDHQTEFDIKHCVEQFQQHYEQLWETASPYRDISTLLSSLPPEMKLAVLSNKDDRFTQRCVEHFFPDTFDYVLGHRPDIPHKPNPQGGNKLMGDLGISRSIDMADRRYRHRHEHSSSLQGLWSWCVMGFQRQG